MTVPPIILQANSLALPLRPGTVSLAVTSPPYWALRAYEDAGEFYDGQLGSEPTPEEFLCGLWAVMDQTWDALRDDGVSWVNLGDKYAGSGGHNNAALATAGNKHSGPGKAMVSRAANFPSANGEHAPRAKPGRAAAERSAFASASATDRRAKARDQGQPVVAGRASRRRSQTEARRRTRDGLRDVPDDGYEPGRATRRNAPDRYRQGTEWARAKSLMGLPWAFVLGLLNPTLYRDHIDPPFIECDRCEGTGVVTVMAPGTPTPEVPDDLVLGEATCGDCDGEGGEWFAHPQWVYRAEQVWAKPNGLPESVVDRPRRSHEVWLMLAKNGDHYGSTDELREPYNPASHPAVPDGAMWREGPMAPTWGDRGSQSIPTGAAGRTAPHPLGKPPGSVWTISAEPFVDVLFHLVHEHRRVVSLEELGGLNRWRVHHDLDPYAVPEQIDGAWKATADVEPAEHFAPFPSEWPRRLVLGWSPSGICTVCGEGRRPVVTRRHNGDNNPASRDGSRARSTMDLAGDEWREYEAANPAVILGYVCSCCPSTWHGAAGTTRAAADGKRGGAAAANGRRHDDPERPPRREYHLDQWEAPPTIPAIVVDVFGGTGTTAMVASVLGRVGISVDLSWDYCQLARWRTMSTKHRAKARSRTDRDRQGTMFGATDNQGATP